MPNSRCFERLLAFQGHNLPPRRYLTPWAAPAPGSQQDAFDGLGFTKSVTEDEMHGPSAARASGQLLQPAEGIEDVPEGVEVKPVPEPPRASTSVGAEGVTSFAEATGQPTKAQAKTLKCGER